MSRYIRPSDENLKRAKIIEAAFTPCIIPSSSKSKGKKTPSRNEQRLISIILHTEFATSTSISLKLDNKIVLLEDQILRGTGIIYKSFTESGSPSLLDLRVQFDDKSYNLSTEIKLEENNHSFTIHQWTKKAPPRVYFDDHQINRGVGIHLEQSNELPPYDDDKYRVHLINKDLGPLDFGEPFDIYVNDEFIKKHAYTVFDRNLPVQHTAFLPVGCHRVMVVSRRRGWTILDTDVVVNGISNNVISWSKPNVSFAEIDISFGFDSHLSMSRANLNFFETTAMFRFARNKIVVDGIKIPKGSEEYIETLKKDKKFSEKMIANYKLYLSIRQKARDKRKKGAKLTEAEKEVEAINSYGEMHEWIRIKKKKEGIIISGTGETGLDGKIHDTAPEPKTPYEKLQRKITLEVHEPSHAEACRKLAISLGLNWRKTQKYFGIMKKLEIAVEAGQRFEDAYRQLPKKDHEILEWGRINVIAVRKYMKLRDNPDSGALEEIQEYEAEVKFYTELIKKLQEEKDRAVRAKKIEKYLGLIIQYFHSIKRTFKNFSKEEKDHMRRQLLELKDQVEENSKFSKEQKAELNKLIKESLDALK